MYFDERLKAKAAMKDYKNSEEQQKCQTTFIRIVMVTCSVLYIAIIPFVSTGAWCL